ncbi:MAG: zinc ribbon domain-containing protein [Candidatus Lokiarchaeota archaeon]|nr:zinc ribbon domain-containing protein [Candidatus Lokiarchaeota archaeon]
MEWENVINSIGFWYNVFIEWYNAAPIVAQVFAIIGIITLLALAITLVYYIIKGIAYLVYYIFKGLYLLLKYIGYGFYKLTEGFYFLVSGKLKPSKQENSHMSIQNTTINQYDYILDYCSECGRKMSERMKLHFEKNGMAFCENCGTKLTLNHALRTLTVSH